MEQLYEKYLNIQLFATKYRGYELLDKKFYDFNDFKNEIQTFEYISHNFQNPKNMEKLITLYLFKVDNKYTNSTSNFKKILNNFKPDVNQIVIMITKEEVNVYIKKTYKLYKNLTIKNYLHKHFIIEINKGPLCSKHTILSPEETKALCYNIMSHGHKLPAIFESDPQNIWIGGEINDTIKIESISEITGKSIRYKIVTPSSGKILQNLSNVEQKVEKTPIIKTQPTDNTVDETHISDNEDYIDDYIDEPIEEDDE